MASMTITRELVRSLEAREKAFEIRDAKLPGFVLRVAPSGRMMYVCQYGRGKRINIGRVDVLAPAEAREKARDLLARVAKGEDLQEAQRDAKTEVDTFAAYIQDKYLPWFETQYESSAETRRRLEQLFIPLFGEKKLDDITGWDVERWRSKRLKNGISKATVNRDVGALKGALSRAVDWEVLSEHPLSRVKPSKLDSLGPVRFLSDDEDMRLRAALGAENFDGHHLPVMVILSVNTGIRKSECKRLRWFDVDTLRAVLTVRKTKNEQTRYVPLNDEARARLKGWRKQTRSGDRSLVFPGAGGKELVNIDYSWRKVLEEARIEEFRWQDLRHTFASRLAQEGIDLNIIRELLGHKSIKMVLRYAHLNDTVKARAVASLSLRSSTHSVARTTSDVHA